MQGLFGARLGCRHVLVVVLEHRGGLVPAHAEAPLQALLELPQFLVHPPLRLLGAAVARVDAAGEGRPASQRSAGLGLCREGLGDPASLDGRAFWEGGGPTHHAWNACCEVPFAFAHPMEHSQALTCRARAGIDTSSGHGGLGRLPLLHAGW